MPDRDPEDGTADLPPTLEKSGDGVAGHRDSDGTGSKEGAGSSGRLFGTLAGGEHVDATGAATGAAEPGLIAGSPDDPVLVAGVGYPLLSDLAFGTVVAQVVASWQLPGVAVADMSHTPVAAYQTITAGEYEQVVIVGAEKRGGEVNDGDPSMDPGAIHEYSPSAVSMPSDSLTALVGQTAMGLNTVENVVVVTRALGSFPTDARVITVEPAYDSWGMPVHEFSDPVQAAFEPVLTRILDQLEDLHDEDEHHEDDHREDDQREDAHREDSNG